MMESGQHGGGRAQLVRRRLAAWLLACACLVFVVLVVGGATRLTHSGLSIAIWQPLVGVVPPLSDSAWSELFLRYQATPEFRLVNPGMDLAGFQAIFWWEYAHRLLARLAGLAYFLPMLGVFLSRGLRRSLPRETLVRLAAIFALGALQGVAGWLMVASGLVDVPRVSPIRLAIHLGLALLLIAALVWTAWGMMSGAAPQLTSATVQVRVRRTSIAAACAVALVFWMALSGAMVAGTHAGHVFNTFPTMNGALVPDGLLLLDPWYENFFFNLMTVQFTHRLLAVVVTGSVLAYGWLARPLAYMRVASGTMLALLLLQVCLGIATLLSAAWLPFALAHQAGAVLLWIGVLRAAFVLRSGRVGYVSEARRAESPIAAASSTAR